MIDTIYIIGMLIALLGFILFLLSETRIRVIDKEIKGIRFSHNERRKFYANYIGYIFLGNDSFIDNR